MIQRFLESFAALFSRSDSEALPYAPWQRGLLVLIVIAGACVRFWGLDAVGLHGDEDTTSLPALHILEDGEPRYPSGMFYGRAILQSYLVAGSVAVFGQSEWALRFPSAVCGVLLIVMAYFLGRRFLSPLWNTVFVATIAYLPALIEMSQTARMYIFLLVCLAGYAILIFNWERTGRLSRLAAAVLMLVLGIQFHTLAVFCAFLVFFPALLQADVRKFWQACSAFAVSLAAFWWIDRWANSFYPSVAVGYYPQVRSDGPSTAELVPPVSIPLVVISILLGAALAWWVARRVSKPWHAWVSAGLIFAGLICQALRSYHLAVLLLLAGAVIAYRNGRAVLPALLPVLAASAGLAVVQALTLYSAGIHSPRNILGVMLGWPSAWTYVKAADYSLAAVLLCGLGLIAVFRRLANRQRIADVWLVFFLWTWLPLLLIGFFAWHPPPRYTVVVLLPILLTAVATLQWFVQYLTHSTRRVSGSPALRASVAAVTGVAIVNPIAFAQAVHAGYETNPDHKGAAQYIKSLHLAANDIVLAEEVITQAYYLGKVDYWLTGRHVAAKFVENVDGRVRDIYTGTPVIGTGEELRALIHRPDRGAIYIIGNSENGQAGISYRRRLGIAEVMQSEPLEEVYRGRDGLTKVWKVGVPAPALNAKVDGPHVTAPK